MNAALVMLALTAGGLLAVQGGLNNTVRQILRAPIGATLVSFLFGLTTLVVMVLVTRESLPGQETLREIPWWAWSGGAWGVYGVAGTILLVPRLGAATTVALNIAGQMLMSLLLDAEAWLGVPQRAITLERGIGAAAVVIAAVLIAWRGSMRPWRSTATTAPDDGAPPVDREPLLSTLLALGLGLAIGAGLPTQAAINARLRTELDAPFLASAISFTGGVLILLVLVAVLAKQRPTRAGLRQIPRWAYLGGVFGAIYVASSVILVPEFGAALTTALVVTGQNVVSLALDHYGWIRLPRRPATIRRVVGVVLLLVGVTLVQLG